MNIGNLAIHYSERLYSALLSLYPVQFRVRFAAEMMQLFRDCCHDAIEKGEVAVLIAFWIRLTRDLMISVLRERSRGLMGPISPEHPIVGIIDMLLIPSMVIGNLIALGPILTLMTLSGVAIRFDQFVVTSGFFSLAVGALAVVASLVITKLRPTVRLWVKLSA
jgi:hypothetical protein